MQFGKHQPLDGTATTTLAVVDFVNPQGEKTFCRGLTIRNDDGTNDLLVSFNSGVSFERLKAGVQREYKINANQMHVKSSAGSVPYSGHAVVAG